MKKSIKFSINYLTNFKPLIKLKTPKTKIKIFKRIRVKRRIICRNLFLFFLYLKYTKINYFGKIKLFIKPNYRKLFTILRAPYRYKLGRYQYTISRFFILVTFYVNLPNIFLIKYSSEIITIVKILKHFYV